MNFIKIFKDNMSQIIALTEKNIKLRMRFKFILIFSYLTPIVTILMPLFVMAQIFEISDSFGPWTAENYYVFLIVAYNISLLRTIITEVPRNIREEKFWNTIPALLIAPFNRFNLLISIFITQFILISIPLIFFCILCYIIYPISIITALLIIVIYFAIALIFSGIGLVLGVFVISNENIWKAMLFVIKLVFWASCITYPFEIFPDYIQNIISLNPFYYIFDLLRILWLENNILTTLASRWHHLLLLIILAVLMSLIGVTTFNRIFKKFGMTGY